MKNCCDRHMGRSASTSPCPKEPLRTTNNLGINNTVFTMPSQTTKDHIAISISISDSGGMFEVVEQVATMVANGLVVPDTPATQTSIVQSYNDDGDKVDGIGPTSVLPVQVQLTRALWMVSLLTLIMVISTTLYKPARGVVFGRNKTAYYLTLAAIFVSGVAEAFTAFWLSHSPDAYWRNFSFGRVVLCASIAPFVAIIGIGGFAFFDG